MHTPCVSEDAKKSCYFASKDNLPTCQFHDVEKGLIRKAHSTGTRVYATIGGYDLSEPFSTMAADPEARKKVRCIRCVELSKKRLQNWWPVHLGFLHCRKFSLLTDVHKSSRTMTLMASTLIGG